MQRSLAALNLPPEEADLLGDVVRESGRSALQHSSLRPVRMLEVGSDVALFTHDDGGPAWAGALTRWRTEFVVDQLWEMAGGNVAVRGSWEPVSGERLPAALHANVLFDEAPSLGASRAYAAYLTLLAADVSFAEATEPQIIASSGPTATPEEQCRLIVTGRISQLYTVPSDLTETPVTQLWITAPGRWALFVIVQAGLIPAKMRPGDWITVAGTLQGELIAKR